MKAFPVSKDVTPVVPTQGYVQGPVIEYAMHVFRDL
jgi:hypothetical protein